MIYQAPGNHEHEHEEGLLDRAVAALRSRTIPEGPPEELIAGTLSALRRASGEESRPLPMAAPRLGLSWAARLAAALFIAVGALAAVLMTLNSSSVAFADIIKKVRDSRTLTFTTQISLPNVKQTVASRFYVVDGERFRMETGDPGSPAQSIVVFDAQENRGVALMPRQKQAVVINNINDFARQQNGGGDFIRTLEALKKLGDKPEMELGEFDIDGRRLRGFVATQEGVRFTVWADPKTGDVSRIEFKPLAGSEEMKLAMTDIRLDPPIDPGKFSLEIPAGYRQWRIDLPRIEGGEASLIAALRGYTSRSGGRFPDSLTDWSEYGKVLKADVARAAVASALTPQPAAAATMTGEAMGFMANVGAIMPFLSSLEENGYGYLGRGKTTGDKGQVVFWSKMADGSYRAIFTDLTARGVGREELP